MLKKIMLIKTPALSAAIMDYIPFVNLLFFFEIIYFMFIISFLMGKAAGILSGLIFLVLIIWQTIGLYSRREIHRKIELFMMDIHFALSVAYIFNRIFVSSTMSALDYGIFISRGFAIFVELPFIIFLTGRNTENYH